jgi:hypothetical protein
MVEKGLRLARDKHRACAVKINFIERMKTICILALSALFVSSSKGREFYAGIASDAVERIQVSDFAGVGTIVAISNYTMTVAVSNMWLGSLPSGEVTLDNAHCFGRNEADEPVEFLEFCGNPIVFFGVTNDRKSRIVHDRSAYMFFDWNLTHNLTNSGAACAPRFYDSLSPAWFLLDDNAAARISILSNITDSIFYTRDIMQLYSAMRDALKPDESGEYPYGDMAKAPLLEIIHNTSETNLVAMLNDTLLAPRLRRIALGQLKRRFDWPATNTVPMP